MGVVVDHLAQDLEYLAAQVRRVERFRADGGDAIAGTGARPGAGHLGERTRRPASPRNLGYRGPGTATSVAVNGNQRGKVLQRERNNR